MGPVLSFLEGTGAWLSTGSSDPTMFSWCNFLMNRPTNTHTRSFPRSEKSSLPVQKEIVVEQDPLSTLPSQAESMAQQEESTALVVSLETQQQKENSTQDRRHSILLSIPSDVLLLVRDWLSPADATSLALTCRDAYALCWTPRYKTMQPPERKRLFSVLEKDSFTDGLFHCQSCNKLHPYEEHWGPHSKLEDAEAPGRHHCGRRDRFSPIGNAYEISFTHAHLVMNRHLYGPKHGIPLENICIEHDVYRDRTTINCKTTAKIIDDELFLLRIYTFDVAQRDVTEFRKCTGNRDFRVCEHTSFFQNSSVYRQYLPELSRRPWAGDDGFIDCKESTGSCGLCVMDYDISITKVQTPSGPTYSMILKAYHQLGACRAPEDWKWARFTESCRPHLFFPNRPNRRGSTHYPGMVKKKWGDGDIVIPQINSDESFEDTSTPREEVLMLPPLPNVAFRLPNW